MPSFLAKMPEEEEAEAEAEAAAARSGKVRRPGRIRRLRRLRRRRFEVLGNALTKCPRRWHARRFAAVEPFSR